MSEQEFYNKYYGALKGAKIIDAGAKEQDDEVWPFIKVQMENGDEMECEISRDPEGNGPGFMFGLPRPE
jgi:hypothetical protein